jgi:hypothetical protein
MYDLWPPADYPNLTAPTPTVTGCTRNSTVSGLSTFTAQTPAVDAVTTRLIRPIFVKGQGGVLRWSCAGDRRWHRRRAGRAGAGDLPRRRRRAGGPVDRPGVPHRRRRSVLSARLAVPRLATQAQLKVLSLCDTNAGQWTEYDSRLEQIPADDPYAPPGVDAAFGDVSPEGVAPPAPPAGLPGFEANSAGAAFPAGALVPGARLCPSLI